MNIVSLHSRALTFSVILITAVVAATSRGFAVSDDQHGAARSRGGSYSVRNLVSDGFVPADNTDPNLVNPWGIVFNPNGPVWVADNGTGVATLYNGSGVKQPVAPQPLVVTIPTPKGGTPPSAPTGIVFSSGSDFVVTEGTLSGPSRFMFATEDGTIAGWAPNVNPTNAILVVDPPNHTAIYKGLALAANGTAHFLYATDFHNNRIDVFDSSFHPATLPGNFSDPGIPGGYAPFGIQNILGNLYVTYAKQDKDAEDDVAGPGFGFVDVFDADGHLIRRFASRGQLNAPWGLALAPADFGRFSNSLLVGNFGDGRINAFDPRSGEPRGLLREPDGRAVTLEGLWGIAFGTGVLNQPTNALFFSAGPDDEAHGLYGRIDPVQKNPDSTDSDSQ
jgi:uncharacterized protein (TIGR03118 family)